MPNITFTEASGVADSIFGKSPAPIKAFIEKQGEAFEQASMIGELFAMGTSNHFAEKFTAMTAMDGFKPVGENGAYPVDGTVEGYNKELEHVTWKDSFSISWEMVEDAKLMDMRKQPAGFISGYYRTREKFAAALYGAAMTGAKKANFLGRAFDVTSADGEALFSKSHKSKTKGTLQTNMFADAFSNDALGALESKMQDFRGDGGEILDVAPGTILIPNDYRLKKAVFEAIGADKDPATANNGFNYNFGRWNVIVWAYLNQYIKAGATPWVLLDQQYNKNFDAAPWLDRSALDVRSEIDPGTDANVWKGRSRFIAGFNDWRFAAVGGVEGGTALLN